VIGSFLLTARRRGLIEDRKGRSLLSESKMLIPITSSHAAHPLEGQGLIFKFPLLAGDHVTDDAGTGFVHTAPGHGREDFEVWTSNAR